MTVRNEKISDIPSRVANRQISLLYDNQPFAMLSTMVVVTLLFGFLYNQSNVTLLAGCYLLYSIVILFRSYCNWRYFRDRKTGSVNVKKANQLYIIGVFAFGLVWCTVILLLFPVLEMKGQLLMLIVVMGFSAAAHTTMGFKKTPIISFILLLAVPMVFVVYNSDFPHSSAIIIAIIFHTAFMLRSSIMFYSSTYSMLHLNEIAIQREQELEMQTAEANSANEAKSEFLSRMSHELRTPLNAVLGMNELLLRDRNEPLSEKQNDRVRKVEAAGKHLLSIVDDVLDFSLIESGDMGISLDLIDCESVILESIKLVENKAYIRNISISVESLQPDVLCVADRKRLKQIIVNLLDNAIKYNKHGGQVSIIISVETNMHVRVSIVDTGYGIPDSEINKLFLPFSRLSAEHLGIDGTGLGLSLCKQLIKIMNGDIGMECQQGKGCCFWIELPCADKGDAVIKVVDDGEIAVEGVNLSTNNRLLLVEDNHVNREVAIDMLEELGYEIDVAVDGKRAVEAFDERSYAMILMDCEMPVMDGFVSTAKIREIEKSTQRNPTPIIALTAHAVTGAKDRCLASGMNDFLSKPFSMTTLHMMLNKWLTNKSNATINIGDNNNDSSQSVNADGIIDKSVIIRLKSRKKKGGKSLMTNVVSVYLEQSSKLLEDLIVVTKETDVEAVKSIVHALKSSSSNVGATAFSALCKEVEARCELGEINDSLIERIHSTYSGVDETLSAILSKEESNLSPLS